MEIWICFSSIWMSAIGFHFWFQFAFCPQFPSSLLFNSLFRQKYMSNGNCEEKWNWNQLKNQKISLKYWLGGATKSLIILFLSSSSIA